jgi:hypothetical protein
MADGLILNFKSPRGSYILTFEDNGKVGYAYLKRENVVISAVWLYNHCFTPTIGEWKERANIPFANCKGYMSEEGHLQKPVSQDDVLVTWKFENESPVANIYIFEDLYGVLNTDCKTGYARFAVKDSPLARVMKIE